MAKEPKQKKVDAVLPDWITKLDVGSVMKKLVDAAKAGELEKANISHVELKKILVVYHLALSTMNQQIQNARFIGHSIPEKVSDLNDDVDRIVTNKKIKT